MLQKFIGAALVVAISMGFVAAEEIRVVIKKVEGDKISGYKMKKGEDGKKDEKGEDVTLSVTSDVKVLSVKFNKEDKKVEVGPAIEGGLKNEVFTGEKGVRATVVTNGDGKVTEIRVFQRKKKTE